ncbi:hypothetical protein PRZ48_006965 [Zasmidium cellare]|uniref:Uncharacterized protein n=1 Tax=Zasmidium cellare TaxID=395010 RepID=A0ABR0EI43_ZASCE|nr:hypothetical protein PRZ48_006965 [Zasmidium cellare]
MHFTKPLALMGTLLTLGLATPLPQEQELFGGYNTDNSKRDVQAANMVLVQDIVAKTGCDMQNKDDLTEEDIAKLSPDDAVVLSGEINKAAMRSGREDMVIPAFTKEDFRAASEEVLKQAAAAKGAVAVRAEALDDDEKNTIVHMVLHAVLFIIHLFG